jgi:hypothetical protein
MTNQQKIMVVPNIFWCWWSPDWKRSFLSFTSHICPTLSIKPLVFLFYFGLFSLFFRLLSTFLMLSDWLLFCYQEYPYSFFTSSLKYFQVDWIISMSFSTLENTLSYAVLLSMIFPFFLLPVVFYEGLLFDLEISLHLASVDLLDSTFKHTIKLEKMKLVFIFVANL